tara:strand:- start:1243 stop:1665 length:423 start_codon:yes stop_codon:yes gene_type:complete
MATLSPLLTATPGTPPTYNVGMAETFSWIPVEGAGRPLFARATYLTNASDISVSLSADNLNINLVDVETLMTVLTSHTQRINGFIIPDYNRIANTYYSTSNNLSQVDYKFDSTIVASLSFTYATPASADNALLAEVIKIL